MSTVAQQAQQNFQDRYISSTEICKYLNITRPALLQGRRRKQLPEPIVPQGANVCLWEREQVWPIIEQWRQELDSRRQAARGSNG